MQTIEIEAPIDLNGNIHLPEPYQYLYGQQIRFVILLPDSPSQPVTATAGDNGPVCDWPVLNPARDFARFIGTEPIAEDGVAFQRHIRDTEWP